MRPINRENEKLVEDFILKNYEYDFETGKLYSQIGTKKEIGRINNNGYKVISIIINKKTITLYSHRVAYFLYYKKWPEKAIDHINQNKLDNRIINLRQASEQENKRNQHKRKDNTSGYKNVRKNKKGWIVRFGVDNKTKNFGTYKTPEEANAVARKIEKELYGEFTPIEKD